MSEKDLIKRLYTSKKKPQVLRDFTPEELGELVLIVLEYIKKVNIAIEQGQIKGDRGDDAPELRPDIDYLSLPTAQSQLQSVINSFDKDFNKIKGQIQQRLDDIREPEDGKDAVITDEQLQEIAQQAFSLVKLPDFPSLITQEPQAVRDSLELLEGEERLDRSAVRGLKELEDKLSGEINLIRKTESPAVGKSRLSFLTDVDISGVTDGQVIKYNASTGQWTPQEDTSVTPTLAQVSSVSTDETKSIYTMSSGVPVHFKRSGGADFFYLNESNGRVGIGTTSPDFALSVVGGNIGTSGSLTVADGASGEIQLSTGQIAGVATAENLTIIGSAGTNKGLILQSTSGVGVTGADIKFLVGNNGGTEAIRILNSGNIGINNSSADVRFHIIDTSEQLRIGYNASNYASFTVGSSGDINIATTGGDIKFDDDIEVGSVGNDGAIKVNRGSTGTFVGLIQASTQDFYIRENIGRGSLQTFEGARAVHWAWGGTNNNPKVSIAEPGGSSAVPDAQLEVHTRVASNVGFIVNAAASQTGDIFQLRNSAHSVLSGFNSSAQLFLGRTSASAMLDVEDTTEQVRVRYDSDDYLSLTLDSSANATFNLTASSGTPKFVFSDDVNIDGTLTLSAQNIATDTTTGMQIATGATQKIGFFGSTPVVRQTGYTAFANLSTDRTLDADSTTLAEVADVLGTLIEDLKTLGIIAA